jgi:hypothetical protein
MGNLKLDFFKISIVIILLGFLFVFYQFSENARYSSENGRFYIGNENLIIDSRTGVTYNLTGPNYLFLKHFKLPSSHDSLDAKKMSNAILPE